VPKGTRATYHILPTDHSHAMRYPSGDLAILSAESYDDGRKRHLSSGKTQIAVTEVVVQNSQEGSTRKRRKTASPDAAGEEEETKRSRGRPRLEPKDETAQDVSHSFVLRSLPVRGCRALDMSALHQCPNNVYPSDRALTAS
jgi:hypothetical protein